MGEPEEKLWAEQKAFIHLQAEARDLVWRCLNRFGQTPTPDQIDYAVNKITQALRFTVRQ
jgi:hypothetical protein